jgi:transcription antitermination factor NusG
MGAPSYEALMKWHVLYTQHHHERAVHQRLVSKGFQSYLPLAMVWRQTKRGQRQVTTPLFPRHVFVRCYLEMYAQLELISMPGVMRLQEDGQGQFLTVSNDEIRLIRELSDSGRSLISTAYQVRGERVQIVQGRLRGISGVICQDAETTLLVPIDSLQASVAVEISRTQVTPAVAVGEIRYSGHVPEA